MNSIWKYPLQVTDAQTIDVPEGSEALSVQVQNGTPCLWARVDPAAAKDSPKDHHARNRPPRA